MTYDQLLMLANRNRDKDGGYNNYFFGNPDLQGLTVTSPDGVNPSFFLHNPETKQGAGGQGWKLSRGEDGSIKKDAYTYDSEMGMLGPLLMATMPVWAPSLGLGSSAAAGGVDAAYLGAADAAGGLMPEFGTFGAYEAGLTGAGTGGLASGASTAGSAASGAGVTETAPGWVSGEGGAGYAGGMAADAAASGGVMNAIEKVLSHPLTTVGASLISGAMSNDAAKDAASAQQAAAQAAIDEQRRQYDQTRTDLAPWRERGAAASNRLATMMGLSGNAQDQLFNKGYQSAPTYTAPNRNAFAQYVSFK